MNYTKTLIGILIMTGVIWIYTAFIQAMVSGFAGQLESMLMGFPIAMGAVVYFLSDYITKMFNK